MNIEKLIEVHGFDVHGGCPGREPSIAVSESALRVWMAGHARVPVEPTPDMIRAGQIASREWSASDSTENGLSPIYKAMLTASKESGQ